LHDQNTPRDAKSPTTDYQILAQDCKDAAVELIKTIHVTYCVHHFFRSWWNNTTYITFGLSILLSTFAREPAATRQSSIYLPCINQALEVLAVMDECEVARNIAVFVQELVTSLLPSAGQSGPLGETYHVQNELDPSQADLGTLPAQSSDFGYDFNAFNFFDVNDPMLYQGGNQDTGLQGFVDSHQSSPTM
jgi:hypothetical protein